MNSEPKKNQDSRVNDTLSRKINRLDDLDHSIQKVQKQLRKLFQQRDQLEAEIFTIRATNPPIKRLPVELLSRIFEDCVFPVTEIRGEYETASRSAVKIVLVCKSWQHIAINTCTLWNHISISLPMFGNLQDHVAWIKKQHLYLDVHLSRSRQAPLKLLIDFEDMLDAADSTREQLSRSLRGVIDDSEERDEWLDSISWTSSPIPDAYFSLCASLIQKLIGKDGQNMLRWSATKFWFPDDEDLAPRIQELFNHSTPRLERLFVTGREYHSDGQPQFYQFLSSIPALSELILSSSELLSILPPCPSLKKLQISLDFDDYNSASFHLIKTFPLLDELTLRSDEVDVDDEDFFLPIIHLPDLKILELCGPLPRNFIQALRVKQLGKLVLSDLRDATPIAHVCQVAQSLEWDLEDDDDDDYEDDPLSDVLATLFSQLHQVHTIAVPHDTREDVKNAVTNCRARDQLKCLREIHTFRM